MPLERDTYWANKFHQDYDINELKVGGDWRWLHDDPTYTATEILAMITGYYALGDDFAESLCLITLCISEEKGIEEWLQWEVMKWYINK